MKTHTLHKAASPLPVAAVVAVALLALAVLTLSSASAAAVITPEVPEGKSTLGDYVWYDQNYDGDHLGSEVEYQAGINGVLVNLYLDANFNGVIDAGEYMSSTLTGDDPASVVIETGWYDFEVTADGTQYIVEIDPSNFNPGGPLEDHVLTSAGTYGASPLAVFLPGLIQDFNDADFGYVLSKLEITKELITPPAATISQTVTFNITVHNVGDVPMDPVPLQDFYSPACLGYLGASPTPNTVDNTLGVLTWNNVGPLAPNQQVVITVDFHAQRTHDMYWKEAGWRDYAPHGIPDFSQKQSTWGAPWFFCGPVSAANSLWWFDSKFEPNPVPPPAINDGYNLLSAYGAWDDHAASNVQPFAQQLAGLMSTAPGSGTTAANLANGIQAYLTARGLAAQYTVTNPPVPQPTFQWVEDEVRRSEDVILLLGFWQRTPSTGAPFRVGGHYVTVAGVDSQNMKIAFSDPYFDRAEAGGAGRVLPGPHAAQHPTPGPVVDELHNNAGYVSHDVYDYQVTTTPGGIWGPASYPVTCTDVNAIAENGFRDVPCQPSWGTIYTEVEYAIAVSPVDPTQFCDPTTNLAIVHGAIDELGNTRPTEEAQATVRVVETPRIGVAKNLFSVTNNQDGTYTVVYDILVQNYGDVPLSNVQVTDNLLLTYPAPASFVVQSKTVTSGPFTINAGYTGSPPNTLLATATSLAVGQSGTMRVTVLVTPRTVLGPYNNTAVATGTSPGGQQVTDQSQVGTNPDPDNDGNPNNNNDPTPVTFTENPRIGVAKNLFSVTNNQNGTYDVVYDILVRNYGDVVLSNVQVTDNLLLTYPAPIAFTVLSKSVTSGPFTINAGYTGSPPNTLLATATNLVVGAQGTMRITVRVTPGSLLGPHNNTAVANGTSPAGTTVTDQSEDDDNLNPDPDNDGNPNNNSEPTPVIFTENPRIGVAKNLFSVANNQDGTYTVVYDILVQNYGDVPLSNVQVTDNLLLTYPAPASFVVQSKTVTSGPFTINAGYTGSPPNTLLATATSLAVGQSGTMRVTVLVTPRTVLGPYNNTAVATGTSPGGTTVTDQSQVGTNPDPDNDGNPNNNNDPTPVTFTENPRIGVAKNLFSVTNNYNGTFDVVYDILVRNYGDVPLSNVQVTDNLLLTYPAPIAFTVLSKSVTSGPFTINAGYTGSPPNTLLATATNLVVGAQGTMRITVRVTPGSLLGPHNNTAVANGTSPAGTTVTDQSEDDDNLNPDPDNDGNPNNNNEPTPVTFPALGTISNLVWWDLDNDGIQDAGEPGIPGVTIELTDGVTFQTTTDANGNYSFDWLPADTYVVTIVPSEFVPGGTLYNWVASPQDVGPDDTIDSDGHPVTHDDTVILAAGEINTKTDFGFTIDSSITIDKVLNTPEPVRPGEPVSYTITIVNTGDTWIAVLPLTDLYDTTYLTYGYLGQYASKPSIDTNDDGQIDWADLTPPDLAPGQSTSLTVWFTAKADTTALPPDGRTVNTARVTSALADPDGTGPIGPVGPVPPQQDTAAVQIIQPTGITLTDVRLESVSNGIRISWRTVSEHNILGFNVLRQQFTFGGLRAVTANAGGPLLATNAGTNSGAAYSFVDKVSNGIYRYQLEVLKLDGTSERINLGVIGRIPELTWF